MESGKMRQHYSSPDIFLRQAAISDTHKATYILLRKTSNRKSDEK